MHWNTNAIFLLPLLAATASCICKNGEVGVGTFTKTVRDQNNKSFKYGCVFNWDCSSVSLGFGSGSDYLEGSWNQGVTVEFQKTPANHYAPPKFTPQMEI